MTLCPRCNTRMVRSTHIEKEVAPHFIRLVVVHTSECPACSIIIKAIIPEDVSSIHLAN